MAAVIEDDVRRAELIHDPLQKSRVLLRADADGNLILFESGARRLDIDADDPRMWPEKAFPELQRPALAATDLQNRDRVIHKMTHVSFVGGEVMLPLVDAAGGVGEEVGPEGHEILPLA